MKGTTHLPVCQTKARQSSRRYRCMVRATSPVQPVGGCPPVRPVVAEGAFAKQHALTQLPARVELTICLTLEPHATRVRSSCCARHLDIVRRECNPRGVQIASNPAGGPCLQNPGRCHWGRIRFRLDGAPLRAARVAPAKKIFAGRLTDSYRCSQMWLQLWSMEDRREKTFDPNDNRR
jgi:hypothetical protein